MSKIPPEVGVAALMVAARNILLDALELLGEHLDGVTVVGAQAVYLRSSDINLPVAPATSDADLVLNPSIVGHPPEISMLMEEADFKIRDTNQPGLWSRMVEIEGVEVAMPVDLLVPEAFAGKGTRSASLPPHEKRPARRVPGLEAALLDRDLMHVPSLNGQVRRVQAWIAGPAALLIAKAHKIRDRLAGNIDRLSDKDATDVVRLMMAHDPEDVLERWRRLEDSVHALKVVAEGHELLLKQFGRVDSDGTEMARRNLEGTGLDPRDIVTAWMHEFSST
jgi:hypothetical protein